MPTDLSTDFLQVTDKSISGIQDGRTYVQVKRERIVSIRLKRTSASQHPRVQIWMSLALMAFAYFPIRSLCGDWEMGKVQLGAALMFPVGLFGLYDAVKKRLLLEVTHDQGRALIVLPKTSLDAIAPIEAAIQERLAIPLHRETHF